MSKISVVINTFNNENIIRDCLESVKDFDEIVICDMYSTDKTLEIAKEYNAKIVMHENIGWVEPARNYAISQASNDWVLVVDSDEKITTDLKEYLYNFLDNSENYSAVRIPRLNCCWGKPVEVLYPDSIIRFLRKDCVYWPPVVHATPEIKFGKIFEINPKYKNLAIIHAYTNSYKSLIGSLNKYTDFELEKLIEKNKSINFYFAIWKSFWIIVEKYFMRNGYKDGLRGLIISITAGIYKFVTYVKYFEYLEKNKD